MQLSAFLNLALTLVSAYILMSLLCTTINEFINILLKTRANTLDQTVTALLDDEVLQQKFRAHGLIRSMETGTSAGKNGTFPSYLDGRTFAHALMGALQPGQPIATFPDLENLVRQLPDSKVKEAMVATLTTAEQDILKARDGIATWFDDTMARLSGVYVRRMKYLSLAMGFGLALVLNVDTFELGQAAWNDRVNLTAVEQLLRQPPAACPSDANVIHCQTEQIGDVISGLHTLPVGWASFGPPRVPRAVASAAVSPPSEPSPGDPGEPSVWDWLWWIALKVGGIVCTAFAISLGAPFWFDILQNIMSLRGTGKKPAPEPEK